MNNILNFMEKIYGDTKTLSIIYIIGAVLLFIFILLLMFSLRKTDKTDTKNNSKDKKKNDKKSEIIEEPKEESKVVEEDKKEEEKTDTEEKIDKKEETVNNNQEIFEKTTIIPLNDEKTDPAPLTKEENIEKALDNADNMKITEEENKEIDEKVSSEIPNVDDYVNDVVKKTYEKNEQFSSVYVNNEEQNLDKVMDNLNVDSDVKNSLLDSTSDTPTMDLEPTVEMPSVKKETIEDEKQEDEVSIPEKVEEAMDSKIEPAIITEIPNEETKKEVTSLDNLKKALDEKKKEVELKQDDLKAKLESLSKNKNN